MCPPVKFFYSTYFIHIYYLDKLILIIHFKIRLYYYLKGFLQPLKVRALNPLDTLIYFCMQLWVIATYLNLLPRASIPAMTIQNIGVFNMIL